MEPKINTTRQKGKYTRKFLENKSLLAADCHFICSQHELSHETIGSILVKIWTPLYTSVNPMVHHVERVMRCVFDNFKAFFHRTRPFSFFQLTSECILLKKVQFVYALFSSMSIVVFSCVQYYYIILLMPHYCTEIILRRFITYLLLLFIKTFHSKLIQVFNFFFTFQFCCLHNLCLLFTFFPLFFFLWTFTG